MTVWHLSLVGGLNSYEAWVQKSSVQTRQCHHASTGKDENVWCKPLTGPGGQWGFLHCLWNKYGDNVMETGSRDTLAGIT